MQDVFETRKNYRFGPAPRLLRREGRMVANNPNWICVEGSDADTIADTVKIFSLAHPARRPVEHEVALARHESGLFALFFAPQLNPFVFANLIAWLGDPRILEGGSGACGWSRCGRDQSRYLIQLDRTNPSEDTAIVISERGERNEFYLPDGSLCPTAKAGLRIEEPQLSGENVALIKRFSVHLDADRSRGNPNFLITRPRNFDWAKLESSI